VRAVVGAVGRGQHLAEVLQGRLAGVVDLRFGQHDPVRPPARLRVDGPDATAFGARADPGLLLHLDLGDHPAPRGVRPGEVDAGSFADQAASLVAADEVRRPQRRAVRQRDVDARRVLRDAHHLATAEDRHPELTEHPVGHDALDEALPEGEQVVVAGGEVADVQPDVGVADARMGLSRRHEPVGDATLVEHLDRAGVETPGPRAVEVLAGAAFDDDDVDPRQRQLRRQHHPGRPATRDRHRVLGHRRTPPVVLSSGLGSTRIPRLLGSSVIAGSASGGHGQHVLSLAASPRPGSTLVVAGGSTSA
jgi:hypothetical protein